MRVIQLMRVIHSVLRSFGYKRSREQTEVNESDDERKEHSLRRITIRIRSLPSTVDEEAMIQGTSAGCSYAVIKGFLSLVSVHCLAFISSAKAQPKRIPIGALFGAETDVQSQMAFKFQVERHNSQPSPIKLDLYEKAIEPDDNFQLTRTECLIMSNGVYAFLGSTNFTSVGNIDSFGRTFRMPFVTSGFPELQSESTSGPDDDDDDGFVLYMSPRYERAVVAVIKHLQWTHLHYLYDTSQGLRQLERIYEVIEDEDFDLEIDVHFLSDVRNSYAILRDLDSSYANTGSERHIVLELSSSDALQTVLNQILHVGMHRSGYHYILGGLAMNDVDLSNFRFGGVNMTGFQIFDGTSPVAMETMRDWQRMQQQQQQQHHQQQQQQQQQQLQLLGAGILEANTISLGAALTMDAVQVIVQSLRILFEENPEIARSIFRQGHVYNNGEHRGLPCQHPPVPWTHGQTVVRHMRKVRFPGLTGTVAFDEKGRRRNYHLDVMSLRFEDSAIRVGTWNETNGLQMTLGRRSNDIFPKGANNTYIVTTVLDAPYVMLRKKQTDDKVPFVGNDLYQGFCADLSKRIADIVHFEYLLKIVGDGKYGAEEANGSWNGMIGELTRREADIVIAPLTITSARERVVDFSMPFMKLGISIMIKKPEKQKPGVFSFMYPLSMEIWTCIAFSYLGVSLTLFLVSRFSPYEWHFEEGEKGPTFANDFTLLNSLWFSLGAFMQQGCDISPRSFSGRLAGSSWWFFTLIIISTYTANLAAFLTVERMLTPINSVDDLVKQSEIRYGTLASGTSKDFFEKSKVSVYKEMWRVMSSDPGVFMNRTEDGVAAVRTSKGKYAFLLESTMNDYYNQKKPCNTMKVGNNLDSKGYGVATPIDHPLRARIGLAVLLLHETGELTKLQKKWWYDKGECPSDADSKGGSSQSALTLSNVAGIFYILIGGLGLSMVVSLLEFLSKSLREARRQKKPFVEALQCCSISPTSTVENLSSGGGGGMGSSKFNHDIEGASSTTSVGKVVRSSAISLV